MNNKKEIKNLTLSCIFVSCLILLINFFPAQGEYTDNLIEDILAKYQINSDCIETLKMNINIKVTGNAPQINSTEILTHMIKRTKNPRAKIIFSNGQEIIINVDTGTVTGMDEDRIWPEPQILFGIKEYVKNSDVEITDQEDDICILSTKTKGLQKEFPKIVWHFNQNTGVIKKVLIYDAVGNLCQTFEVTEYQLINNTIWFPKKIIETTTTLLNKIQKEIIYENVEINIEISDEEFINANAEINIEIPDEESMGLQGE